MRIEPRSMPIASEAMAQASASPPPSSGAEGVAQAEKTEPGAFAKVLAHATDAMDAHESRLHAMTHAGQAPALSPEDLLALQSDVYRYSATVDLTSKVVAQGTQGIQTVLKGGGQ